MNLSITILTLLFTFVYNVNNPLPPSDTEKLNGVNFVSPVYKVEHNCVESVTRINANWVAITPFAFMSPGDPKVEYNCSKNWWGDTPAGIKHLAQSAKAKNLKILLKPHFWVDQQGWPGDYDLSYEDWPKWERNYESFMMQLARISEALEIDMICIGTEFKIAVKKRRKFWNDLIAKIRRVYSGKITYAANWDNYQNVHFWDKLDYIGIDAYHPLVDDATPETEDLVKAWSKHIYSLQHVAREYNKQILFTEYGYRSIHKNTWHQWEIEGIDSNVDVNLEAQTNAYEAIYQVFWNEEWFAGGFLWKWWDEDKTAGGMQHSNYTPQNKPVEQTIKKWYSR